MKYIELRKKIRAAYFTLQDLRLMGLKVYGYQLSLWQKRGHLVKIKNGLYAFAEEAKNILPEELASAIYSPSYLSLEAALSRYGFIPEMVYAVTSVTPKITRNFKNRVGNFIYRHIKPALYFGYKEIDTGGRKYLRAEPEKALLDFFYYNLRKIKSSQDLEDFRLNKDTINKTISRQKMEQYLERFKNEKMKKIMTWLKGKR